MSHNESGAGVINQKVGLKYNFSADEIVFKWSLSWL